MKIADLKFDERNANKGTQRGRGLIEKSLQKYGFGRSILLDKHNNIVAGNKTAEVAGEIGLDNVRVVETDGKEIIAVKRTDLDLSKKGKARELAIADNRTNELSLEWDIPELEELKNEGYDLEELGFTEKNLNSLFKSDDIYVGENIPEYLSFVVDDKQREIIEKRLDKCQGNNRTEQLLFLCKIK